MANLHRLWHLQLGNVCARLVRVPGDGGEDAGGGGGYVYGSVGTQVYRNAGVEDAHCDAEGDVAGAGGCGSGEDGAV